MDPKDLNRRDFHKLSMAALGGVIGGVVFANCGPAEKPAEGAPAASEAPPAAKPPTEAAEKHVCRGLNACKGQGAGGENTCAGSGGCATSASHSCKGSNECKGQGGCGETPGANACSGQGGCAVPLQDHAWGKARTQFEEKMKGMGKAVADAPPAG